MDALRLARAARDGWAHGLGVQVDPAPGAIDVLVDPPGLAGYTGHLVFELGDGAVVTTSPAREGLVRRAIAGHRPDELIGSDVMDGLRADGWVVLGPSRHHYADRSSFRAVPTDGVRRVTDADGAAVEAFRALLGDADWFEGGFGPEARVMWGVERDGALVAMGNMTEYLGRPADVGVATLPASRGRGLARAVASAMTLEAFDGIDVVRYKALETNAPSLRVAAALGFAAYGRNVSIRPPRR